MTDHNETFVLRTTLTSPFGRKVRMAADVLGLNDRIRLDPADTLDENDTLRSQNPLGKMPCLLLPDGGVVYDSRVIIEFLQEIAGGHKLLPARDRARYRALTAAALADGLTDAALLVVYESRFRNASARSNQWLAHQHGKIARALKTFEDAPPDPGQTDIVSIGLSCALGYLDWRQPVDWRSTYPGLVAWLGAFARHEPAFERTDAVNPEVMR